jgi:small subunit ribosomal protein S16
MLSIRLSRVGKKKAPVYRIVVMPKHSDPWAKSTEILGHYNPRKNPSELVVQKDRVEYWLNKGAQASDTVWNLLVDEKIIEGKKRTATHISKKRSEKLKEKAAAGQEKDSVTAVAKEDENAPEEAVEEVAPEEAKAGAVEQKPAE